MNSAARILNGVECPSYFKAVDFILDAIVVICRPYYISSGPAYKDLCIKDGHECPSYDSSRRLFLERS